jgi:hypothetical protein
MSPAATAAASTLSLPGFPRWSIWLLLLCFLASIVVICVLLRRAGRRAEYGDDDPWPGWQHHDGRSAADALTDPNLVTIEPNGQMTLEMQLSEPVGYGITEPQPVSYGTRKREPVADITSFDLPATTGEVVSTRNWAQAMTVPAPAIVAHPVEPSLAERWIADYERGAAPDPSEWTRQVLVGAGR